MEKVEKTKKNKKKILSFLHKSTIKIVLITIFIIASVMITQNRMYSFIEETSTDMSECISTAKYAYTMDLYRDKLLLNFDNMQCNFYVKSTADYLNNAPVTQDRIDTVEKELGDGSVYFYFNDGTMIHSVNSQEKPELTDEEFAKLLESTSYRNSQHLFNSVVCNEGRLLIEWAWDYNFDYSASPSLSAYDKDDLDAIVISKDTGVVVSSTELAYLNENAWDGVTKLPFNSTFPSKEMGKGKTMGLAITKNKVPFIYMEQETEIDDMDELSYFIAESTQITQVEIISIVPCSKLLKVFFYFTLRQIVILLLVIIFTSKLAFFLADFEENSTNKQNRKQRKLLWGEFVKATSLFKAFFLVCVITSLLFTAFIQVLTGYSNHIEEADTNMKLLTKAIDSNRKKLDEVNNLLIKNFDDCLDYMDFVISDNPDLENEDYLKQIMKYWNGDVNEEVFSYSSIENISFFNNDGLCTVSSDGFTGHQISKNDLSEQSKFWSLLDRTQKAYHTDISQIESPTVNNTSSETTDFFFARLRNNNEGLIVIKVDTSQFLALHNIYGPWFTFESINDGIATLCAIDLDDDDYLFFSKTSNDQRFLDVAEYTLDEKLLKGNYRGEYMLLNTISRSDTIMLKLGLYFVTETIQDNILYINFIPEMDILHYSISGLFIMFFAYIATYIVLMKTIKPKKKLLSIIYLDRLKRKKEDEPIDEPVPLTEEECIIEKQQENMMNSLFLKYLNHLLISYILVIISTGVVEMLIYKTNSLSFLNSSNWHYKLNIFSLTNIFLALVGISFVSYLISQFICFICDNMGNRATTIGQLIASLVRFLAIIIFIIFVAIQLGLKASHLLTGAGIVGIVITYAGQGLISDLLSGIFIVFEGDVKVGDWVKVDEWRGQIEKIGVRTTILDYCGDKKVYNNSKFENYTVLSRTMGGAVVFVSVDYGEDIDEVIKVVNDNISRYQKEIPHIIEGPKVHGVTELGDNGVTLRIGAFPDDPKKTSEVQRDMLRVTKKIFDEHGITIPFPQVVVHQEKEKTNN